MAARAMGSRWVFEQELACGGRSDAVAAMADLNGDGGWVATGGSGGEGGYAVARQFLTARMPPSLSLRDAAALPMCFLSAFASLYRAVRAGDAVYIPGCDMGEETPEGVHVWLVFIKALHAVAKRIHADLDRTGLGESDFRVLEVLLHKGTQPVNVIGPKVNLTPGSISVAVDRLHGRGLVSRVEDPEDRRVRFVDITPRGRELIVPVFRRRAALLEEVFAVLRPEERVRLERLLKTVGRHAESLSGTSPPPP